MINLPLSDYQDNKVSEIEMTYNQNNNLVNESIGHCRGVQNIIICMTDERRVTLVEWATSKKLKIMNTQLQKNTGRRWTRRSPGGNMNNEINYTMTDKPSQHWK